MSNEELVITVATENGEMECSVLTTFEMGECDYIALMPHEADEIILFRYKELEGDAIELISIDDDEEFQNALTVFDGLMESVSE